MVVSAAPLSRRHGGDKHSLLLLLNFVIDASFPLILLQCVAMTRGLGLEAVLTKALPPSSRFIAHAWSTNFECGFVAIASAMNCARRVCTGSPRLSPHAPVMIAWHACLLPFVLRGTNQLLHEMFAQAASRYDNPINREVWACVWCVSSMRMLISFSDGIAARRFRDRGAIAFGMYAALPVDIAENEIEQSRVLTWAKFTAKTLAKQMICALIMRQESLRFAFASSNSTHRLSFDATCDSLSIPACGALRLASDYLSMCWVYFQLSSMFDAMSACATLCNTETILPAFDNPLIKSRGVRDCWSRRWNKVMHHLLRDVVAAIPGTSKLPIALRALLAFLLSGLVHEGLVIFATPHHPRGMGCMTAFFLVQWFLVTVEVLTQQMLTSGGTKLKKERRKHHQHPGLVKSTLLLLTTMLVITPTCPLFLYPLRENGIFEELRQLYV